MGEFLFYVITALVFLMIGATLGVILMCIVQICDKGDQDDQG